MMPPFSGSSAVFLLVLLVAGAPLFLLVLAALAGSILLLRFAAVLTLAHGIPPFSDWVQRLFLPGSGRIYMIFWDFSLDKQPSY